jgi:hypothetical protein
MQNKVKTVVELKPAVQDKPGPQNQNPSQNKTNFPQGRELGPEDGKN